jgi:hypothetical protein
MSLEESFDSLLQNIKSSHRLGISRERLERVSLLSQLSE